MTARRVEFPVNGKTCEGYLATPPAGTGPGLLVLQEWWGLVEHIEDVADRFAAAGYVALAPDLYHGSSTSHPDEADRLMMALDIERAGKDLRAAAKYLLGLPSVSPKKVGVLGFCMGGQLALYAATQAPEITAVVDFYGIHPSVAPPFEQLNAPVLCHFGKHDGFISLDTARALVATLRAAGKSVESHEYEAGHAFFNDTRPNFDADAAKLAWERTLEFLERTLA